MRGRRWAAQVSPSAGQDLDFQEVGPIGLLQPLQGRGDVLHLRRPLRRSVAASLGDRGEVHIPSTSRLAANRIMHRVVDQHVLEVLKASLPRRHQSAHVHDRRTIPIDAQHRQLRLRDRDAQGDGGAMAHAADRQKILLMALALVRPQLKDLPRSEPGRRDQRLRGKDRNDPLQHLLAVQHVRPRECTHVVLEAVLFERLLLNEQCKRRLLGAHVGVGLLEDREGALCVVRQDFVGHIHLVQQARREPPLQQVLRLVLLARLASPTDHQQHRDGVHLIAAERQQWVHGVPQA
mmetsp:Transcript_98979/g.284432  ORF Transcript_98979/g.284432 Transcript_98979/m.284432 type:complete len:292 (+) Transcript_98979:231-1106(+)